MRPRLQRSPTRSHAVPHTQQSTRAPPRGRRRRARAAHRACFSPSQQPKPPHYPLQQEQDVRITAGRKAAILGAARREQPPRRRVGSFLLIQPTSSLGLFCVLFHAARRAAQHALPARAGAGAVWTRAAAAPSARTRGRWMHTAGVRGKGGAERTLSGLGCDCGQSMAGRASATRLNDAVASRQVHSASAGVRPEVYPCAWKRRLGLRGSATAASQASVPSGCLRRAAVARGRERGEPRRRSGSRCACERARQGEKRKRARGREEDRGPARRSFGRTRRHLSHIHSPPPPGTHNHQSRARRGAPTSPPATDPTPHAARHMRRGPARVPALHLSPSLERERSAGQTPAHRVQPPLTRVGAFASPERNAKTPTVCIRAPHTSLQQATTTHSSTTSERPSERRLPKQERATHRQRCADARARAACPRTSLPRRQRRLRHATERPRWDAARDGDGGHAC